MKTMIKQLSAGGEVVDFFVCSRKAVKVDRRGNTYLDLRLSDASGQIAAKKWDATPAEIEAFSTHDVIKVKAVVTSDNYGMQLKLEKIRVATPEDDVDLAGLLPASARSLAEMEAELEEIRAGIGSANMTALLDEIFADTDMYRAFCDAPAAKGFHHNYIHGLLEHSISVSRVAAAISDQYGADVNRDLLLTSAILHDIGKTAEFEYEAVIDYSDSGRLLGHIVLGERIVAAGLGRLKSFPEELALQLQHLILSHHGEREFGSPIRPKTLEAFILHHADDIDAKANVFQRLREEKAETGEAWSDFNRVLERFLYLKKAEAPGE